MTSPRLRSARLSEAVRKGHRRRSGGLCVAPELLPIAEAFASDADVSLERAMASICLKVNGRIFAMAKDGRLVLKLPADMIDTLVEQEEGERYRSRPERPLKEWIALAPKQDGKWLELARHARAFVGNGG